MQTDLQNDLSRFFALLPFDTTRVREIADLHVSTVQRTALLARLDMFVKHGSGAQRQHARRLIDQINELN